MSRQIKLIVIHCAATPNGRPVSNEQIDDWHRARGFRRTPELIGHNEPDLKHIGYHWVIGTDGFTRMGRGEQEVGAHVRGYNRYSLGICLVGTDRFYAAQWRTLKRLVEQLQAKYPEAQVVGHRELSPDADGNGRVDPHEWTKTCPGFCVSSWMQLGRKVLLDHLMDPEHC